MRALVLLVFVSLLTACGGGETVCDLTEQVSCSVELETGDLLLLKFPEPRVEDNGPGVLGTEYTWGLAGPLNQDLLIWSDEEVAHDDKTERVLKAVGPGSVTLNFGQQATGKPVERSRTVDVTITGDAVEGAAQTSYLFNIEVAGGLGASVESGASLNDLSLYPTDLFAEGDDVFVVSEGRLWAIDTAANVGTIEIDSDLAGTAWPAGGTLVSMSPLDDGGYIALIGLGTSISVVRIAADLGSFTEVYSATSLQLRPDCMTCQDGLEVKPGRIRASRDGSNWVASADFHFQIRNGEVFARDAVGRTGHLVDLDGEFVPADMDGTGMDHLGRVLYWGSAGGATGGTGLAMWSEGQAVDVFGFVGINSDRVDRETDFMPFSTPNAAVVGLSDGTYWTHSHHNVMGETQPTTVPRGLFVHRP